MAIEGLLDQPATPATPEKQLYLPGTPDVNEAAGVTFEAMDWLKLIGDKGKALETITFDYERLATLGYAGRLFVRVTAGQASFNQLLDAAEGRRPEGVDPVYVYPNLWVPATEAKSYTKADLEAGAPAKPQARLALFNPDPKTDVDPVLLHLNQPFDDKYRQPGEITQVESLKTDALHGYSGSELIIRDDLFITLMDRVRGTDKVPTQEQYLSRGFKQLAGALGRRSVEGDSFVGGVYSGGGRLELGWSRGDAFPGDGVGFSVGLNELEPQAS